MGTAPQQQPFASREGAWGAIDVDSDRVEMLVARLDGGEIEPLISAAALTGLADGVEQTGLMDEGRVELTAAAVAQMAEAAREAGAHRLSVVCLEPVRSVVNADELLDRITQLAGILPRVLSELDEARLSFRGIVSTTPDLPQGMVVVEPGLLNTLVLGARGQQLWWSTSVPTGLTSLATRWGLQDPPSLDALSQIVNEVEGLTASLAERHPGESAVACGSFSDALRRFHGAATLDQDDMLELIGSLSATPSDATSARAEIAPARAAMLGAAAAVLEGVRRAYAAPRIELIEAGLREGLILEQALADGPFGPLAG